MKDTYLGLRRKILKKEFSRMNDMQLEAVFSVEGPLLVLAGAGSGKTTVIVHRIANIIKYGNAYHSDQINVSVTRDAIERMQFLLEGKIDENEKNALVREMAVNPANPWEILAITFTNKAASELKDRLMTMLGERASDIWASTFHSACVRILRRNAEKLGYSSHFTIYDTDDSKRVMKECQKLLGIDDKMLSHKSILSAISRAKDNLVSHQEYQKGVGNDLRLHNISRAYTQYQAALKTADAMDFDDIIFNTVRLLEDFPDVLSYYQKRFRYIMVDEYQDTNHAQYCLTALLAGGYNNLCVVGDDDQSIYRFRGATIENILSFEKRFNKAKVIRLERNYRSTQTILDAANGVISNNEQRKGKTLFTENEAGEHIVHFTAYDEQNEARYIADSILSEVSSGSKWSDHAVLYRMNAQSNTIENAFVRSGIPYRIIGGHRFYERKEIKDALAYLAVINNHNDNVRLKRIINEPKRGIGNATINYAAQIANGLGVSLFEVIADAQQYPALSRAASKLKEFSAMIQKLTSVAATMSPDALFSLTMELSGYKKSLLLDEENGRDRLANLDELLKNLGEYVSQNDSPDLSGFLEEVALMTDIDNYNAQTDAVILMTIHSAKGLEFPQVFLIGMEEGIFPGLQSMNSQSDIEEERRLAYVGITRAKKKLVLTCARTRQLYGSTTHNRPSRFLNEIPDELLKKTGAGAFTQSRTAPITGFDTTSNSKSILIEHSFSNTHPKPVGAVFSPGDTVTHKTFGVGVVLSAQGVGNDTLIEIAFEKTGTKKLMANYAKLEKISG